MEVFRCSFCLPNNSAGGGGGGVAHAYRDIFGRTVKRDISLCPLTPSENLKHKPPPFPPGGSQEVAIWIFCTPTTEGNPPSAPLPSPCFLSREHTSIVVSAGGECGCVNPIVPVCFLTATLTPLSHGEKEEDPPKKTLQPPLPPA